MLSHEVDSVEWRVETRSFARSAVVTILFDVGLITLLWRAVVLKKIKGMQLILRAIENNLVSNLK